MEKREGSWLGWVGNGGPARPDLFWARLYLGKRKGLFIFGLD
jgi:hypothetical protein